MDLERRIAEQAAPKAHNHFFSARLGPFTSRIRRSTCPANFKTPKMPVYSGNSDPYVHMDSFQKVTRGRKYSDAMQCQLFSEMLEGEVMSWFFEQPSNLVDSFKELRLALLSRFSLKAEGGEVTKGLFKVKQH